MKKEKKRRKKETAGASMKQQMRSHSDRGDSRTSRLEMRVFLFLVPQPGPGFSDKVWTFGRTGAGPNTKSPSVSGR